MTQDNSLDKSLIHVSSCILCGSSANKVSLNSIKDNVIGQYPYNGEILKCLNCGHAYLNPRLNTNNIHKAYSGYYTQNKESLDNSLDKSNSFEKYKEYYNYRFLNKFSLKGLGIFSISKIIPFSIFFLKRAVRFLPKPPNNKVLTLLDVGCGSGDFLIRASCCGYHSTGIDFDPETIDIARARGLNAIVCEIDKMPNNDLYDAVVLSHVLEHVEDPVYLLKSIFKKIKPGGYFYIATPNYESAGRKTFKQSWRGVDAPRHMHYFNIENLRNILEITGFKKCYQVYDLPQSIGVIKSSFKIKYKGNFLFLSFIIDIINLLKNKFYSSKRLEVGVFRCEKPL